MRFLQQEPGLDPRFNDACVLVLKVTNRCNLSCSYCYDNIENGSVDMPLSLYKRIISTYVRSTSRRWIAVLLHGGEPTLMPLSWLKRAVIHALEQAERHAKKLTITVQSNFVALDKGHMELALKYGLEMGASLDGPPALHCTLRGKAERAVANFKRMKLAGITPSVLMTINNENQRHFRQVIDWVKGDLGVDSFKANVVYPVGRASRLSTLTAQGIFTAHKDILLHMIRTCGKAVIEHNLAEEIVRFFAGQEGAAFSAQIPTSAATLRRRKGGHLCRPRWEGPAVWAVTVG